jgi:hypothetical protein
MSVAGSQFRPGVANANHWAAIEDISRESLISHPAPVDEALFAGAAEPLSRSKLPCF